MEKQQLFTYLYVDFESYNKYVETYGTNRLDKYFKILPPPSKTSLLNYDGFLLEAFEGIETNYEIEKVSGGYLI